MERDIGDILDRLTIAKLKSERIGTEENKREYEAFKEEIELRKIDPSIKYNLLVEFGSILYDVNNFIWLLESGLKSGKETLENPHYILDEKNKEALSKIGATTILIRNFNHLRVKIKNLINKISGEGFEDIKKDHLSE